MIGGGVGLKHYLNLRPTVDLDLCWTHEPSSSDRRALEAAAETAASEHGYLLRHRSHGDVTSIAFVRERDSDHAEFSVEVAMRDVQLAPYRESAWPPVLLESLADNVASKMVALVSRGHWRDFADIYAVVDGGLMTASECWELWTRKQRGMNHEPDLVSAELSVLRHLARLRQIRPIETIQDSTERVRAARLRAWFAEEFTAARERGMTGDPDAQRATRMAEPSHPPRTPE